MGRTPVTMHPSMMRAHVVASGAEFVGTFVFLFFGYAGEAMVVEASSLGSVQTPTTSQVFYVAVVYGFSLLVTAWAFYRISGGLFNPAVRVCRSC
jgi:aquaporin rerated protein, other eukaryote